MWSHLLSAPPPAPHSVEVDTTFSDLPNLRIHIVVTHISSSVTSNLQADRGGASPQSIPGLPNLGFEAPAPCSSPRWKRPLARSHFNSIVIAPGAKFKSHNLITSLPKYLLICLLHINFCFFSVYQARRCLFHLALLATNHLGWALVQQTCYPSPQPSLSPGEDVSRFVALFPTSVTMQVSPCQIPSPGRERG